MNAMIPVMTWTSFSQWVELLLPFAFECMLRLVFWYYCNNLQSSFLFVSCIL